jgi:ABC-type multidrug transport system permease subunit
MRRVLHLALHDTRLFLMQRENFFFMFGMPVLFMLFFSTVLKSSNDQAEKIEITLNVLNQDTGFLSTAFLRQLQAQSFDLQNISPEQAGTTGLTRVLRIPSDFTEKVLAGEQVDLTFEKESNSNVNYDVAADVHLHRAQVAFLGTLIEWSQDLPDTNLSASQLSEVEKGRFLAMVAEPSRVRVIDETAGRGRPVPSGAGQSIPGMLAMFVVMTVLIGGSETLTKEKYGGTLARLASTPFSRMEILAGKVLHLTLVGLVQAIVLMLAGQLIGAIHLFGIEFSWGPHAAVIVLMLIPYAFAVACLTLLVSGLFRTTQQAESLAWLLGMIIAALGGCWWPLEIMPHGARLLAQLFPSYWAMRGFHALITFGMGPSSVVLPSVILAGFGILFAVLGSRTMRVAQSG